MAKTATLIIAAMLMGGCAHKPSEIPVVPLETIVIHAGIPQHVELCLENPDVWIATRARVVCKRLIEVREWYALQRAAN